MYLFNYLFIFNHIYGSFVYCSLLYGWQFVYIVLYSVLKKNKKITIKFWLKKKKMFLEDFCDEIVMKPYIYI